MHKISSISSFGQNAHRVRRSSAILMVASSFVWTTGACHAAATTSAGWAGHIACSAEGCARATTTGSAPAPAYGTIEGATTTLGGQPLNGMCGKLYDAQGNTELVDFAGTGTDGTPGHYTQTGIHYGRYVLLFVNCGANTDGVSPDFHYTPIFYGNTWTLSQATRVVVTAGGTTNLGSLQIPYGGFVAGTVRDHTLKAPADSPPVAFVPLGGGTFFLRFSWTIVCGNPDGTYSSNSDFQQGVPVGATLTFAPAGWGCGDSQGNFNSGKWIPARKSVNVSPGNTVTVNANLTEAAP